MKFKNTDWSVSGSKRYLKVFAKDLEDAGYKIPRGIKYHLGAIHYGLSDNGHIYGTTKPREANFTLPDQWTEALNYATEKEEKLEVGKWYKHPKSKFLAYYPNKDSFTCGGFGFDMGGDWSTSLGSRSKKEYRPATDKEVEEALIAEAKRRGFKKGVRFACLSVCAGEETIIEDSFRIYQGKLRATTDGCTNWADVFKDGQWAEIIEDKVPEINGYKMVVGGKSGRFGCARIYRHDIERLLIACGFTKKCGILNEKYNRTIKSITLDSGVTITVEELKEIVKHLEK